MTRCTCIITLAVAFFAAAPLHAQRPDPANPPHRVDRNVIYGMYSGLALLMDVHRPDDPNGYGIVHVSGSGWGSTLSYDSPSIKDGSHAVIGGWPLVAAGYTVFSVNHRATPRFHYPAAVEDVQRAVRFVRYNAEKWGIDPDHIGAIGGSSGGHLVSMLGTLDGDGDPEAESEADRVSAKVQCVVARATPSDLTRSGGSFLGFYVRGDDTTSEEYRIARRASPVTHVSSDDPPFLFVHGDSDTVVPIQGARVFRDRLEAAGVVTDFKVVEGAGHGPSYPGAKIPLEQIQSWYVAWFDKHLKGK